jgi:hypothetical protein
VRDALATLPWVEQRTIDADRGTHTVTFGVNDRSKFSMDKIKQALAPRYRRGLAIVEGPS